jgi:hypothetical protein
MARTDDPWVTGSSYRLRDEFIDGLESFRQDDWDSALELFRSADEQAEIDDIYQSRYTSFHGLVRVYMGDRNGVKLCRKAAAGEINDAEVFYNLVMAENRLDFREGAYMALRRGLKIDGDHPGLNQLKKEMTLREKKKIIPGLKRKGFLNQFLGKFFRGSRKSWNSRE